jgi:GNAT superfamily N-acetyltransferase
LEYRVYEGQPPETIVEQIRCLYEMIFQISSERMAQKMKQVIHLLAIVAFDEEKAVGFKIGYESDFEEFYSWIGGVDPAYRRRGIGSKLMTMQHEWLRKHGYKIVTTQTKNKWRAMLLLKLRHGFDIIGTFTDEKGEPKIILQKRL